MGTRRIASLSRNSEETYDVFAAAAETHALEVVLNAPVPVHQQLAASASELAAT